MYDRMHVRSDMNAANTKNASIANKKKTLTTIHIIRDRAPAFTVTRLGSGVPCRCNNIPFVPKEEGQILFSSSLFAALVSSYFGKHFAHLHVSGR